MVTLLGSDLAWQASFVGAVGLGFLDYFSNFISMLILTLVPIVAVLFCGESMDWVKMVAVLLAIRGCCSHLYQNHCDEAKQQKTGRRLWCAICRFSIHFPVVLC